MTNLQDQPKEQDGMAHLPIVGETDGDKIIWKEQDSLDEQIDDILYDYCNIVASGSQVAIARKAIKSLILAQQRQAVREFFENHILDGAMQPFESDNKIYIPVAHIRKILAELEQDND